MVKIVTQTIPNDPNAVSRLFHGCSFKEIKQKTMTIKEFRSYPNCADYTDEQATEIINTLEKLAVILFDFTCLQNGIVIDNQIGTTEDEALNTLNQAA